MKNQYLECGKVINKRGIGGELKLECYCDSPVVLKNVKILYGDINGQNEYKVTSVKEYKGFLYLKLEGVSSAEEADALRGKVFYVSRDDIELDEGGYFIADLIGLEIRDADNDTIYGTLEDVINYGASDIYVVSDGKREYMLPAVDDMIVEINLDSHILIRPIQGIFDDAEEIH